MNSSKSFRLNLFGSPSLSGESGALITGPAIQRHRVALLALVTLAPGRSMSRDKLISYLWPESDTERARQLLNQSVYQLRKALGDAAIISSDFGGNPPHIEYALTERGMLLLPLLESLRQLGLALKCNSCEDRLKRLGAYCEPCPHQPPIPPQRREKDDSIVLL